MSDVKKVSVGKPKIGGAVSVAPLGTELPSDAKTALNPAFKNLGYISDDGLKNSNAPDTDNTKAWGGDIVITLYSGKEDTFEFNLIEALNEDVIKTVYGAENVKGSLSEGLSVNATNGEAKGLAWVIDMILKGGVLKRIVISNGTITDLDEIVYKDDEPIGYGIKVTALPDDEGITHKEYIVGGK